MLRLLGLLMGGLLGRHARVRMSRWGVYERVTGRELRLRSGRSRLTGLRRMAHGLRRGNRSHHPVHRGWRRPHVLLMWRRQSHGGRVLHHVRRWRDRRVQVGRSRRGIEVLWLTMGEVRVARLRIHRVARLGLARWRWPTNDGRLSRSLARSGRSISLAWGRLLPRRLALSCRCRRRRLARLHLLLLLLLLLYQDMLRRLLLLLYLLLLHLLLLHHLARAGRSSAIGRGLTSPSGRHLLRVWDLNRGWRSALRPLINRCGRMHVSAGGERLRSNAF
jgi:hypothetical protein